MHFLPRHSIVINIRIDLLSFPSFFFLLLMEMMEIWSKLEVLNLNCNRSPLDNVNSVEHFNWFLFFPLCIYLLNWAEDGQFNEIKRNGLTFYAVVFFNLEQMIDWQHANRWEIFSFPIPMSIIKRNIVRRRVWEKKLRRRHLKSVSVLWIWNVEEKRNISTSIVLFPSVFVFRLG